MFLGCLKLLVLSITLLGYVAVASNSSWRAKSAKVRCMKREREALLHFKAALGNNSAHFAWSSWDTNHSNTDCCYWEGVLCSNKTGRVLMLHLAGDSDYWERQSKVIPGQISPSLLELQSLMYLNLSFNYFEDAYIPEFFGYLTKLRYLDLRSCSLSNRNIPSQLGSLPHLQYLDLSGNYLTGSIPYQFGNLSQLQYLDLHFNYLKGSIPYQFGNLSLLQYLDVSSNDLHGSIPCQLGNLSQLHYLKLTENYFVGGIPYQLGKLSHLQHLDLSQNFFEGKIPYQLGNLLQLKHLDISLTDLRGAIPCQLGNLSNLQKLFLGDGGGDLKIDQENSVEDQWLSSLTSLTHLQLSQVTDLKYSHKWLKAIEKLPNLKELTISNNNFSDKYILSLPPLKFNSSSLSYLDLSGNNFMSSAIFYWISNVSSGLFELHLSSNFLMGPIHYEFGRTMNSLETLSLRHNQLKGGLKPLGNLSALRSLYLGDNQISTLLDLSTLTSLETFDISYNLLNGTIPEDLRFPSSLRSLSLGSNSLNGVLTDYHFANLRNLNSLDLSGNSLALRFSHNWVPPFQLQYIYLRSCRLGPSFPEWLLSQKNVTQLDISNAGILGTIPKCFWDQLTPELIHLNVSCNNISGMIPNVSTIFVGNPFISLAYNHFEGPIPQFLRNANALILSNNFFSELHPVLCANGATDIMMMYLLDLSNNQLSGQLPDCWGYFKSLLLLDVSNNFFFGAVPPSIGSLQSLQVLILRNNRFIGELPATLKSCSNLQMVDVGENKLSGPMPPWIGIKLPKLQILILRKNTFSGSLSMHLCYLSSIRFFDISLNNVSGQIPKCFSNFSAMVEKSSSNLEDGELPDYSLDGYSFDAYDVLTAFLMWKGTERQFVHRLFLKGIDLSSNQLTGRIPEELVVLVEMVILNLSRNQLDGEIPFKIGLLTSLESLDLSRNHLFGHIPSGLAHIDWLSMLDLSHNNLSGRIPIGTQLQGFDSSTYEGNPDLCGKPLQKMCPQEGKHQEQVEEQEDKHAILSEEFYWGMAIGFIIGFCGIFGSILFLQSWRHAYFGFLSNLSDTIYVMVTLNTTKFKMWLKGYLEKLR